MNGEKKTYRYISGWEVRGLEYGLEYWSSVLESVLEYRKAVLGLVLEYRRVVLVLGLDLRLSVLGLDSYLAKAVLVPSLAMIPLLAPVCVQTNASLRRITTDEILN